MSKIENAYYNVGYLDRLSYLDTPVHRLDPRAKLITILIFIICVVSFDKYEISGLLQFLIFPIVTASLGSLPMGYMIKRILIVAPFAVLIGIFNPVFNREIVMTLGSIEISGGWISFISILLRFVLTVSAALVLIATSGMFGVCTALERLKVSKVFANQLLFLYRYIFVLIDEAVRLVRARSLRSFNGRGLGMSVAGSMIGHLLIRTINRARRIHLAMLSRGFSGEMHILKVLRFSRKDFMFILGWTLIFIFLRFNNVPVSIGRLIAG